MLLRLLAIVVAPGLLCRPAAPHISPSPSPQCPPLVNLYGVCCAVPSPAALAFWLMKRHNLIDSFQLDSTKLARFLRRIEDAYPGEARRVL